MADDGDREQLESTLEHELPKDLDPESRRRLLDLERGALSNPSDRRRDYRRAADVAADTTTRVSKAVETAMKLGSLIGSLALIVGTVLGALGFRLTSPAKNLDERFARFETQQRIRDSVQDAKLTVLDRRSIENRDLILEGARETQFVSYLLCLDQLRRDPSSAPPSCPDRVRSERSQPTRFSPIEP